MEARVPRGALGEVAVEDVEALLLIGEELVLGLRLDPARVDGEEPAVEEFQGKRGHFSGLVIAGDLRVHDAHAGRKDGVPLEALKLARPAEAERLHDGLHGDKPLAEAVLDHEQVSSWNGTWWISC